MITDSRLEAIISMLNREGVDERSVSGLRRAYPEMHFTYCNDDDVGEMPAVTESEAFNLYLIDGRDHCLALTNDQENATGLVIAEKFDD